MIYIFHFFIITILFTIFGRNKQTENLFVGFSFIYVLFVFGQRWMTGTDFPNYLRYFLTDFQGPEWGYYTIQNFLKFNNLYFGILIFTVLLITQFNFYRFFLKFDKYATLMIALFLISEIFLAQMSQIRQYVAISFFINSMVDAYDEKPLKSIVNLIFAASFHSSALFLFPLLIIKFPFTKKNISKKALLFILVILFVFPFLDMHHILNLPIFGRYSNYIGSIYDVPLGSAHYIKFYTMLSIFIFYSYFMAQIDKTQKDIIIINGLLIYLLIYGLSFKFAMLYRVAIYFQIFEIVFLVNYSNQLKNLPALTNKRIVALLFLGIFALSSLLDSYLVANYQFRPLRLYENRSREELYYEIDTFYD